ncbi:ABC transporter ATP-binding protein [Paenibacillus mucilaginosus]|uniref:ABC transporter related protein n=1 Tax=Paenibacillus mucilaginosus (strain KNP414) TaxID=1036673 RepID=F8FLY7_PAEMK|nr:ABC transporter ATP-binding protein [Paenibacillus mucilaginosus]AEI45613.1 ABC transporter related protein [Paenibacillus mucilaginosus KNP414]MCG7215358.1 ABC transporter ATP-binding protein [Paenibacillus mucilaginosus]WDM27018.1 ABC transporter ATP-binding protein [Paenibacillus mucilaginosus]
MLLEVNGLQKKWGEKRVIHDVSFEVHAGEVFGILGPNGAGKTTTLKIITGLLRPDEGKCLFEGNDMAVKSLEVKRNIGYISDASNLYENLTGREYVQFMARLWDVRQTDYLAGFEELVPLLGLEEKIDQFIRTYSKGMKQKAALLGALIHRPQLLILDEPLTGLDPESNRQIKDYLKQYAKLGNSIIFSTHILEAAEKLCNRILIMKEGRSIAVGTIEELRRHTVSDDLDLEDIFLALTQRAL